jgi:hypothetical protein
MTISRDVLYDPDPDGQGTGSGGSDGGTDATASAADALEQSPSDEQPDAPVS